MPDRTTRSWQAKLVALVGDPRWRRRLLRLTVVCGAFHLMMTLFALGCLALGAVEARVGIRAALTFLFLGLLSLRAHALVREKRAVGA